MVGTKTEAADRTSEPNECPFTFPISPYSVRLCPPYLPLCAAGGLFPRLGMSTGSVKSTQFFIIDEESPNANKLLVHLSTSISPFFPSSLLNFLPNNHQLTLFAVDAFSLRSTPLPLLCHVQQITKVLWAKSSSLRDGPSVFPAYRANGEIPCFHTSTARMDQLDFFFLAFYHLLLATDQEDNALVDTIKFWPKGNFSQAL